MDKRSSDEKFLVGIFVIILLLVFLFSAFGRADIIQDIRKEAVRQGVDPNIAVAVAKVESGLDPQALGIYGEIGLFQIMPYYGRNLWNPKTNIRTGIFLLKRMKQQCADMHDAWVVCYNNGMHRRPRYPQLHPYYKRVMEAME